MPSECREKLMGTKNDEASCGFGKRLQFLSTNGRKNEKKFFFPLTCHAPGKTSDGTWQTQYIEEEYIESFLSVCRLRSTDSKRGSLFLFMLNCPTRLRRWLYDVPCKQRIVRTKIGPKNPLPRQSALLVHVVIIRGEHQLSIYPQRTVVGQLSSFSMSRELSMTAN